MKRVILAGVALATLAGLATFHATHHTVQTNCHYSIDADATICDFHYEGNK